MIWNRVGAFILWFIALFFLRSSLFLTKEAHQRKSFADYAPNLGLSNSFIGFIVELVVSFFIGLFMKRMPWWMARSVLLLIGLGLIVLGINCII
jgi:F0F1-type ATP synthase assembly protein I